eukprot:12881783-Prorocentrum_lima.AAC.1
MKGPRPKDQQVPADPVPRGKLLGVLEGLGRTLEDVNADALTKGLGATTHRKARLLPCLTELKQ